MIVFPSNLSSDDQRWQHTFLNRTQQVKHQIKEKKTNNNTWIFPSIISKGIKKVKGIPINNLLCLIIHSQKCDPLWNFPQKRKRKRKKNDYINLTKTCSIWAHLCGCYTLCIYRIICIYIPWLYYEKYLSNFLQNTYFRLTETGLQEQQNKQRAWWSCFFFNYFTK